MRYEYKAGVAQCWVVDAAEHIEYDCGPLQRGRIDKASITAVGISDDRHLTKMVAGGAAIQRATGVKGGLGGLLIAYQEAGESRPRLATITFDFGDPSCQRLVAAVQAEFTDRFLGTNTRDGLMTQMGVSKAKENLVIAAIIGAVVLVSALVTFC